MENKVIELTQVPVIEYSAIDAIANEVATRMQKLDLDNLVVTEDNFKTIKNTRSELSKEFKEYENVRKLIKDKVMKPYNDFEAKYKQISNYYKGADDKLKLKINAVEDSLLVEKIDNLKLFFDENNKFDFVDFESVNLHITRSKSDKSIQEEINAFLENVKVDLATIDTLPNNDRVLAKYQQTLDLTKSISDVNIDIANEERIAKQREEQELKQAEMAKAQEQVKQEEVASVPVQEEIPVPVVETKPIVEETGEVIKTMFSAIGTMAQLKMFKGEIKEVAERLGVKVE